MRVVVEFFTYSALLAPAVGSLALAAFLVTLLVLNLSGVDVTQGVILPLVGIFSLVVGTWLCLWIRKLEIRLTT